MNTEYEKLSSATEGGGRASFWQEEYLVDPVECWTLIFDMVDCESLTSYLVRQSIAANSLSSVVDDEYLQNNVLTDQSCIQQRPSDA